MTSWPEHPADGHPPQTRRQVRESERTAAARQETRHAAAAEPAAADETSGFTPVSAGVRHAADPERPTIPATAFAEPGVLPPSRGHAGGNFDSFLFSPAEQTAAGAEDTATHLFRQSTDQGTPEPQANPASVAPAPAPTFDTRVPTGDAGTGASAPGATPERTLTRRELRAMQQAQTANRQANQAPPPAADPAPFTSPSAGAAAVPAQEHAGDPVTSVSTTPAVADVEKKAWPFAPLTPSSGSAAQLTPAQSSPAQGAPASAQPAPADPSPGARADAATVHDSRSFTPSHGHWSAAAEAEEQSEPIISRNVGQSTAATATNALILPTVPRPDTTAPLTSTGEILVTGSIDLPRGIGATGLNPQHLDSADIDNLLDSEENEFTTSEVAPVRASRAISTHTSTRGVIAPPKKRGNALPTVLIVTAGVLAVGVIGLLVAAYWLKVF